MGIRYYAYAFDQRLSDQAQGDPRSLLSEDPLADAWGLEPHATCGYTTFEQSVPLRDMLYLDKSWRELQIVTGQRNADGIARPAFAMFEGEVTMHHLGWEPWVRPLFPEELPEIKRDLEKLVHVETELISRRIETADAREVVYAMHYLRRAYDFVSGLVADGRGMVYMIG